MLKATFHPAKGGPVQSGSQVVGPTRKIAARDQPSHKKLKLRAENDIVSHKRKAEISEEDVNSEKKVVKLDEEIIMRNEIEKRALGVDSDNSCSSSSSDSDEGSDSSGESDEDDMQNAMRELERIKKERAASQRRLELEKSKSLERNAEEDGSTTAFKLKERWDDDVPFRNQAVKEKRYEKRFVNDTIRSDFHRKFIDRYIK